MKKREFGHEPSTFTKSILGVFKRQTPSIQNEYVSYYQDFDDSNIYMRRLKGRNDPKDIGFYSSDTHTTQQKSRIYGGEHLDLEDRKQLKYLQEEKHITKGGISVGSTGHLKDL